MTAARKTDPGRPFEVPLKIDDTHRRYTVGGEPIVVHCHHFNTYLQQSLCDARDFVDMRDELIGGGASVAHAQLTKVFAEQGIDDIRARLGAAEDIYRWAGFGTLELLALSAEGGEIRTKNSHYAHAWKTKFGPASENVCFFDRGWISGCLSAVFDRPLGTFSVDQNRCLSREGEEECVFVASRSESRQFTAQSPGVGPLTTHSPIEPPPSKIGYDGILEAVQSLPLTGDDRGEIFAFGVYLTRHYANYYNRLSFEFVAELTRCFGSAGTDVAEPLLIESGHVCAFNTFGGIMKSSEWEALIQPNLTSKEDWIQGMVAVVNALGWGRWQVQDVSPEQATFVIHDDYEEIGYLAAYGTAERPACYLARGAAIGMMNLVYYGDIETGPDLTPEFYDSLFKSDSGYDVTVEQAQSMGADHTVLRVTRKKS